MLGTLCVLRGFLWPGEGVKCPCWCRPLLVCGAHRGAGGGETPPTQQRARPFFISLHPQAALGKVGGKQTSLTPPDGEAMEKQGLEEVK